MKIHLKYEHGIDENAARELENLIKNNNDVILNYDTITCRYCRQIFPRNYFFLVEHLITHIFDVPLELK